MNLRSQKLIVGSFLLSLLMTNPISSALSVSFVDIPLELTHQLLANTADGHSDVRFVRLNMRDVDEISVGQDGAYHDLQFESVNLNKDVLIPKSVGEIDVGSQLKYKITPLAFYTVRYKPGLIAVVLRNVGQPIDALKISLEIDLSGETKTLVGYGPQFFSNSELALLLSTSEDITSAKSLKIIVRGANS